jgi:hypothetical protein
LNERGSKIIYSLFNQILNFMGLMKDNDLTDGISGRVGNKLVFRTTKGGYRLKPKPAREALVRWPEEKTPDGRQAHSRRLKKCARIVHLLMKRVGIKRDNLSDMHILPNRRSAGLNDYPIIKDRKRPLLTNRLM